MRLDATVMNCLWKFLFKVCKRIGEEGAGIPRYLIFRVARSCIQIMSLLLGVNLPMIATL